MNRELQGHRPVAINSHRTSGAPVDVTEAPAVNSVPVPATPGRKVDDLQRRLRAVPWPRGQRVLFCSLDGGVGRSTLASVAALAIADARPENGAAASVLYIDPAMTPHSATSSRLGLTPGDGCVGAALVGGELLAWRPAGGSSIAVVRASTPAWPQVSMAQLLATSEPMVRAVRHVVVDCVPGPPVLRDELAALVYVTRPDEDALTRLTDHLVWLVRQGIPKNRISVVVNHHVNRGGWVPRSRRLATALAAHVSEVVHVQPDKALGPGQAIRLDRLSKSTKSAVLTAVLAATPGR